MACAYLLTLLPPALSTQTEESKALSTQAGQEGITGLEFYQRVREIIGKDSGGNKQVRVCLSQVGAIVAAECA
jgi:hypothetical protein